jgi:hypothetical protein
MVRQGDSLSIRFTLPAGTSEISLATQGDLNLLIGDLRLGR